MAVSGQSAVFGKRKEPHTVIIARGDEIRHFTVRPWLAAVAGSALAAVVIGYLGATSYLVLRDNLIGAATARQARIQQAYEDRISALRAQVDRITSRQLLDQEQVVQEAIRMVENNGIVFLDEIDKICARAETRGADVSREGVQRDLLPLIEGTTVSTKHGPVKTDHILFIASGAFHVAKPSDLLPELQGRLPIRVELQPLNEDDFVRILTETDNALTRQYEALMATEQVAVTFTEDGIAALARIAAEVNRTVENIGARRLYTVMERVFEELSFTAPDRGGDAVQVDAAFVESQLGDLARSADLSRYVL